MANSSSQASAWWRSAVVYQVYPRSFADGNGDGIGDIAGLRRRLPYLARLGVDAVWINPWYPSPMKDAGYDVADYRAIDSQFGTLKEAETLFDEAHALGLKVLLDLVPNHTSDQHPWFQQALRAAPGSTARERYIFRDGRGPCGDEPPNNWMSEFGGSAWTRVRDADGRPGQWYLHLYAAEQPDLNWDNAEVRADFEKTLRFWFERGVDGFRIDVAHAMVKARGLPDLAPEAAHPFRDLPGVHDIFRQWRLLADSYDVPRVFVAEAWVSPPQRLADYVRGDELHTAFNFDFLVSPWRADWLRASIARTVDAHAAVGAPPTWVLSNHDVVRTVSRYARPQRDAPVHRLDELLPYPADLSTGVRRARAAALLMLALPGSAYIYQGEELGLPEVEDLPDSARQDPVFANSGGRSVGRDGCRVPIPWAGNRSPFGFCAGDAKTMPWLPQPASWSTLTVAAQEGVRGSMLELYREALQLRRTEDGFGDGSLQWLAAPAGAIAFSRGGGLICMVNIGAESLPLPKGARLLLASDAVVDDALPTDTSAWLRA